MEKYCFNLPITNKILDEMFIEYFYLFGPIKTK